LELSLCLFQIQTEIPSHPENFNGRLIIQTTTDIENSMICKMNDCLIIHNHLNYFSEVLDEFAKLREF